MSIQTESLQYLSSHHFIRNSNFENFIHRNNGMITADKHIFYCVGLIRNIRIVHAVRLLAVSESPGITAYYIEWFNTACTPIQEINKDTMFESIRFWVHSGVALRKNFFLFEDRMSLLKSSFIFDPLENKYHRLLYLLPYIHFNTVCTDRIPIYNSLDKVYFRRKKAYDQEEKKEDRKKVLLKKSLRKLVKSHNQFNFLQREYVKLFEEIERVINK